MAEMDMLALAVLVPSCSGGLTSNEQARYLWPPYLTVLESFMTRRYMLSCSREVSFHLMSGLYISRSIGTYPSVFLFHISSMATVCICFFIIWFSFKKQRLSRCM